MHRHSKSPKKMTERSLTKTDIRKMVQRIRTKKTREQLQKLEESATAFTAASNEELESGETSSGVNVCIFPCNNPIERVIAECFKHAKHGRAVASLETSQCNASEDVSDVSLSACENLLSQVSKKVEELQNEVKLYQTQNDSLKDLQQQYQQMVNSLQKDKDEFEVYKQREMLKLKAEMDEEKRKMRVQKRHNEARQAIVKAKPKAAAPELSRKAPDSEASKQLQRRLNTVTGENTRLKAKLELAKQDRDSLKAMVKQLEEQRLSLLDKLEKSTNIGCYPSMDSLAASPRAQLIVSALAPSNSDFRGEGRLQLAQESAHGDSLCMEVKPEKREASFDLSSEVCIREGVARTGDKGSDSVLYAATVVARLSLDNALAARASRQANSPVVSSRNSSNPIWSGDNYAMEQAELAEERAVKKSMGGVFRSRSSARDFGTWQDRLGITESETHAYFHSAHVRGENVRNIPSGEVESNFYCGPSLVQASEQDCEIPSAVTLLKGPSPLKQGSKTRTKTGIITKEVLTGIPSGLLGLHATSQRWMSSESLGIRNVLGQDGARTASPLMPVCHERDRIDGALAVNSVSYGNLSTQTCNARVCPQTDCSAEQNSKRLPVSDLTKAQHMDYDCRKQNAVVMQSSQKFEANKPFNKLQQSMGATVASSGIELKGKFGAVYGESSPQDPGESGISSTGGRSNYILKANRISKQLSAETGAHNCALNSGFKADRTEHTSNEFSKDETIKGSQEVLENLENLAPINGIPAHLQVPGQMPSVETAPSSKLPDRGLTTQRSCEGRVGTLIKKYSQVNAGSPGTPKKPAGMMAARKSRSAQVQFSTALREKSQEGSPGGTWALDSSGHSTLLTLISKEVDPFTQVIIYTFQNGDKKNLYPDGKVVYHYAKSQTVHTVYPCGKKEIQFANGQRELHEKDGDVEVTYPNGTIRRVFCTGEEEQEAPDGTVARRLRDGTEIVHYPNGQKEVRHESYKSRSYPNGTVKTVYPSGKQITKYSNGRVRVKDANGTVLVNTSS